MNGSTTVAGTMYLAHLAGIKVFGTPVSVVSAGVKSILDIGKTLEYLETMGVPIVTY